MSTADTGVFAAEMQHLVNPDAVKLSETPTLIGQMQLRMNVMNTFAFCYLDGPLCVEYANAEGVNAESYAAFFDTVHRVLLDELNRGELTEIEVDAPRSSFHATRVGGSLSYLASRPLTLPPLHVADLKWDDAPVCTKTAEEVEADADADAGAGEFYLAVAMSVTGSFTIQARVPCGALDSWWLEWFRGLATEIEARGYPRAHVPKDVMDRVVAKRREPSISAFLARLAESRSGGEYNQ